MIVSADLAGADAQVVAWESEEEEWKDALRKGMKLHSIISIEREGTDAAPHYDMYKRRIHATDYGGSARTIYQTLAGAYGNKYTSEAKEEEFQSYWFERFPGILKWHKRVEKSTKETYGVRNQFGNRIVFQDRPKDVFTKALAWIPQSTVALTCEKGAVLLIENFPYVQGLSQVHDSFDFQIPKSKLHKLPEIQEALNSISIPYKDPLRIPWDLKISDKSWGDCT